MKKLQTQLTDQNSKFCSHTQDFLNEAASLFGNDVNGTVLFQYVVSRIRALNLYNLDPHDVLSEAMIRGVVMITNNRQPIRNPRAWLRITSNNVLLEEVRKIKGYYQLSDELLERVDSSDEKEIEVSFGEYPARALQAFRGLSKSDRRIVMYKLLRGKTYREINQLPAYLHIKESALRKQYSRAIKLLRENFRKLSLSVLLN